MDLTFHRLQPGSQKEEWICPHCIQFSSVEQNRCQNCFETLSPYDREKFPLLRIKKLKLDERYDHSEERQIGITTTDPQSSNLSDLWKQRFNLHWEGYQTLRDDAEFLGPYCFSEDLCERTTLSILSAFPTSLKVIEGTKAYSSRNVQDPISRLALIAGRSPSYEHQWLAKFALFRESLQDGDLHGLIQAYGLESEHLRNLRLQRYYFSSFDTSQNRNEFDPNYPLHAEFLLTLFHWTLQVPLNKQKVIFRQQLNIPVLKSILQAWNPKNSKLSDWKNLGLIYLGDNLDDEITKKLKIRAQEDVDFDISLRMAFQLKECSDSRSLTKALGQSLPVPVKKFVGHERWARWVRFADSPEIKQEIVLNSGESFLLSVCSEYPFGGDLDFTVIVMNRMDGQKALIEKVASIWARWLSDFSCQQLNEIARTAAKLELDLFLVELFRSSKFQPDENVWKNLESFFDRHPDILVRTIEQWKEYETKPKISLKPLLNSDNDRFFQAGLRQINNLSGEMDSYFWLWLVSSVDSLPKNRIENACTSFEKFNYKSIGDAVEFYSGLLILLRNETVINNMYFADWIESLSKTAIPAKGQNVQFNEYFKFQEIALNFALGKKAARNPTSYAKWLCHLELTTNDVFYIGTNIEKYRADVKDPDQSYWLNKFLEMHPLDELRRPEFVSSKGSLAEVREEKAEKEKQEKQEKERDEENRMTLRVQQKQEQLKKQQEILERTALAQNAFAELNAWYQTHSSLIQGAGTSPQEKAAAFQVLTQEFQAKMKEIHEKYLN